VTEFELHSLINDHYRDQLGMIQFWVSVTFAVIVARFVAGTYLRPGVLKTILVLYLMATGLSVARYALLAARIGAYLAELETKGFSPLPAPPVLTGAMVFFVIALPLTGTLATVYFLTGRGTSSAHPTTSHD
jgi:hypothetical protein